MDKVEVLKDDLVDYLTEYHNPSSRGNFCKADGSPWPCPVVARPREAAGLDPIVLR